MFRKYIMFNKLAINAIYELNQIYL